MEINNRVKMDVLIQYDCRWTTSLDERFVEDYLYVQKEVFGVGLREEFRRQFEENIYGPSVVVVVYLEGSPVASRALWRNDIEGQEAYQPGATCVMPICRGKGIFTEMTQKSIAMLPPSAIIYNFPNDNSYPGYIKMGWTLLHDYKLRIMWSVKSYTIEHPIKVDSMYFDWWLKGKKLSYCRYRNHYFLIKKDTRKYCYRVIAETDRIIAEQCPRIRFGLLFYKSENSTWYNRRLKSSHVVVRGSEVSYIPTWKIDAV